MKDAKIDKVKKVKEERLECYIFSKLILIVSGWRITWQVANWLLAETMIKAYL